MQNLRLEEEECEEEGDEAERGDNLHRDTLCDNLRRLRRPWRSDLGSLATLSLPKAFLVLELLSELLDCPGGLCKLLVYVLIAG